MADRKERGYYDTEGQIAKWSKERLMVIELKKLGVAQGSISQAYADEDGYVHISFMFGYAGKSPEKRDIVYIGQEIPDFETGNMEAIDCFFQKSLPLSEKTADYVSFLKHKFSGNASVIIGNMYERTDKSEAEIGEVLGDQFNKISMPNEYADHFEKFIWSSDREYGMQLFGFVRN
jgi:hypothetical protein